MGRVFPRELRTTRKTLHKTAVLLISFIRTMSFMYSTVFERKWISCARRFCGRSLNVQNVVFKALKEWTQINTWLHRLTLEDCSGLKCANGRSTSVWTSLMKSSLAVKFLINHNWISIRFFWKCTIFGRIRIQPIWFVNSDKAIKKWSIQPN